MQRIIELVALLTALNCACAQSVRPVLVEDASPDGAVADGAADVSTASAAQALGKGAVVAITLNVDTAGHAPAMDRWLDGEFAAIARGHSAFGYYIPLRRAGALGEQQIASALRSTVLARWMDPIGPGRSLRSAPTPVGFVRRDGEAALWITHGTATRARATAQ